MQRLLPSLISTVLLCAQAPRKQSRHMQLRLTRRNTGTALGRSPAAHWTNVFIKSWSKPMRYRAMFQEIEIRQRSRTIRQLLGISSPGHRDPFRFTLFQLQFDFLLGHEYTHHVHSHCTPDESASLSYGLSPDG